ncbi:MAG TPA: DUF5615 family PIN-like protein [Blastocatellia bacterium]
MTARAERMALLFDENIDRDIVRGLELRLPNLDFTTVQEVGLAGREDPEILEWAASNLRILVTHDLKTMPKYAAERIRAGLPMPGVFAVASRSAPLYPSAVLCLT